MEAPVTPAAEGPADYGVETHGVDTMPDSARTPFPRDLVAMLWGGNMALSLGRHPLVPAPP